jgi:hypothetical protein
MQHNIIALDDIYSWVSIMKIFWTKLQKLLVSYSLHKMHELYFE